jgi:hypothetical protein
MGSIERIAGKATESEKEEVLDAFDARFDDQRFQGFEQFEREKTAEEIQIIGIANEATDELRGQYGLKPRPIPLDNIHIFQNEKWDNELSGFFRMKRQAIAMPGSRSRLNFLEVSLHELVHFKSYNSVQITKDLKSLTDYRCGLLVVSRDGAVDQLKAINEALTEELVIRLFKESSKNSLFEQEKKKTEEVMRSNPRAKKKDGSSLFEEDTYYVDKEDGSPDIYTYKFTYGNARRFLRSFMQELYIRNAAGFRSEEDVFQVFARAAMTGNILPLGKLVDRTFGSGSLKSFGGLGANVEAQQELLDSLSQRS